MVQCVELPCETGCRIQSSRAAVVPGGHVNSIWNDLERSSRWRGVVSFIRNWVGPFDSAFGMVGAKLDAILAAKALKLPAAVWEWYLLAANWKQVGLNVWIHPQDIEGSEGIVWILTDTEGITHWGVRVADFDIEDPPVVSLEQNNDVVTPTFSKFVAAMVVNDVLFGSGIEEPIELKRNSAHAHPMHFVTSCCGDFFADGPLESATVVMFAYPENGEVYGRSRTPAGRALLRRLRQQTA